LAEDLKLVIAEQGYLTWRHEEMMGSRSLQRPHILCAAEYNGEEPVTGAY
jgi:hypothetical protein